MKRSILIPLLIGVTLITNAVYSGGLTKEAELRGVNSTCIGYLKQIEEPLNLSGLNLTFANPNPEEIKTRPSLHSSTSHFNNGVSIFSATLSPNATSCDVSLVLSTFINNQSCDEVVQARVAADATLKVAKYAEGTYTHIYPESNAYQLVLVATGKQSCSMTESRMMWLGD